MTHPLIEKAAQAQRAVQCPEFTRREEETLAAARVLLTAEPSDAVVKIAADKGYWVMEKKMPWGPEAIRSVIIAANAALLAELEGK